MIKKNNKNKANQNKHSIWDFIPLRSPSPGKAVDLDRLGGPGNSIPLGTCELSQSPEPAWVPWWLVVAFAGCFRSKSLPGPS